MPFNKMASVNQFARESHGVHESMTVDTPLMRQAFDHQAFEELTDSNLEVSSFQCSFDQLEHQLISVDHLDPAGNYRIRHRLLGNTSIEGTEITRR